MICYRDKTFCSGGTPRCALFATCSKALTEDIQARAKAAAMPISQYLAPTAMPCYRSPDKPEAKPKKHLSNPRVAAMTDSDWRKHFEQKPQPTDNVIAEAIGCSSATVRNHRIRLGYPSTRPFGVSRPTIYTEADALRLVAAMKKTKGNLAAAGRSLGILKNTSKHLRARFSEVFEQHGF